MARLTEKDTHRLVMGGYKIVDGNGNVIKEYEVDTIAKKECDIYNKLKELEDIEQELGIELSVLFDKKHIVSNDVSCEIATNIVSTTNKYEIYEPAKKLRISMALTKEELEK